MKTISEIKNEVAKVKYDSSFKQALTFMHKIDMDYFMDEVAKRYAEEALREAAEKAEITWTEDKYDEESWDMNYHLGIDKSSILNIIKELK